MQCDVRDCPEDEIVPLFNTMFGEPKDIKYDGERCRIRFEKGNHKIVYYMYAGRARFEFYTGTANVRFDGVLEDVPSMVKLLEIADKGRGTKVSDFITLEK